MAPVATQAPTGPGDYLSRPPWDDVVYFMLPDRLANGDPSNHTGGFDPTHKGFCHSGDLTGLTARLDDIKNLGATATWLGPIYKNEPVQGAAGYETSGYHGYWITDFLDVDPHDGGEYVVAANTGTQARAVNIAIDSPTARLDTVLGECPQRVTAAGVITLSLAPFAVSVCRAKAASTQTQ